VKRHRGQAQIESMPGVGTTIRLIFPRAGKALAELFSTHPPLEKRLAALGRLESQLQGVAA
jgi:Zn-dependent protease with chaperone function